MSCTWSNTIYASWSQMRDAVVDGWLTAMWTQDVDYQNLSIGDTLKEIYACSEGAAWMAGADLTEDDVASALENLKQ